MTWIKICGITNHCDAELAVRLGADAIGFVFVPSSPRFVKAREVRAIARDLAAVTVGVFADQDEDTVRRCADEAGVSTLQLHGSETPDFCARFELPVIKAFRGPVATGYRTFAILVDGAAGWPSMRGLERGIIAGGLTPANVRAAIRAEKPFGVDLASGIEASPGKKDEGAMRRFFEQVRS
jgi:phosphoribosylanthranilate isomerase